MINRQQFRKIRGKCYEQMLATEGHRYTTILKTRCDYCGRSPRQKGKCRHSATHLLNLVEQELFKIGAIK